MAMQTRTEEALEVGRAFAEAYATGDYSGVEALLDPNVHYREVTPNRILEATGPAAILAEEREFLERYDRHETLELATAKVGGRVAARTRWRLHRGEEIEVVEWFEYMTVQDGRIAKLDAVCSGPMSE